MKIFTKSNGWILFVIVYISFLVYFSFTMMSSSRERILHNEEMLQEVLIQKEHHIKVSEDNNRLLKEILAEINKQ